jgi:hypothetical protein
MVSQRRDVIPKCDSHTNEELLFCETCDKIFCQLCDQHQISAEHTVVPFSLAIKRMNEILSFKASKSKTIYFLFRFLIFFLSFVYSYQLFGSCT